MIYNQNTVRMIHEVEDNFGDRAELKIRQLGLLPKTFLKK